MNQMMYVERIKDLREDHDLTQQYVANILGTSQTMYARYERGANEMPIRHLLALCELYQVSSDYILGLHDFSTAFENIVKAKNMKADQKIIYDMMKKIREEGRAEGKLEILYSLVKDNMIPLSEAAKRAEMSDAAFLAKINKMFPS